MGEATTLSEEYFDKIPNDIQIKRENILMNSEELDEVVEKLNKIRENVYMEVFDLQDENNKKMFSNDKKRDVETKRRLTDEHADYLNLQTRKTHLEHCIELNKIQVEYLRLTFEVIKMRKREKLASNISG